MPSSNEEFEEPQLNPEIVQMLVDMGIPTNAAKHAVFNTGNQSADLAIGWFYENIENPICNEPLRVKKQGAGAASKGAFQPSEEGIMMITSMGLTEAQARRGLRKCNNDIERAMDFIFSHMDEPDSEDEMQVDQVYVNAEESKNAFENVNPQVGVYAL